MVVPRFLRNSVQLRATLWDGFVGSNVGFFAPPLPVPEPTTTACLPSTLDGRRSDGRAVVRTSPPDLTRTIRVFDPQISGG